MRSHQLQAALSEFVEAAASHLDGALASGAEVPFELEPQRTRRGSGAPPLYCYRALTGEFIAERRSELERLPSYGDAARLLEGFEGLDRYLANVCAEPTRGDARSRARAAIAALLREVFDEQTDFELHPERLRAALERLERSAVAGGGQTTLVATLHGLTISSTELALTTGLTIARPHVLEGLPEGALACGPDGTHEHLIVALAAGEGDPREAIGRGREVLKDLLRALRLFGDGRVTLGALAWARVAGGKWKALALGTGGRPHGMLVVRVEQEDELRAFCNLVSRRAPHGNELAWALRRFELGCERESSLEALTDHLLALRVLLEPEGPSSGLLPGRLAALCATPERRVQLAELTVAALALERAVMIGAVAAHAGGRSEIGQRTDRAPVGQHELTTEMADHLRALLRDVICGHLDVDLVGLADKLLSAPAHEPDETAQEPVRRAPGEGGTARPEGSVEEVLGDAGQAEEILDIFI
jgi:hypothetical protein